MQKSESEVSRALSEVIRREERQVAGLTRIGNWVIGATTVIGVAATSVAAVQNDRGTLWVAAAGSALSMVGGAVSWIRAKRVQGEVETIREFSEAWSNSAQRAEMVKNSHRVRITLS